MLLPLLFSSVFADKTVFSEVKVVAFWLGYAGDWTSETVDTGETPIYGSEIALLRTAEGLASEFHVVVFCTRRVDFVDSSGIRWLRYGCRGR